MSKPKTITVAAAANALCTNSLVITRWIQERKIPAILSDRGYQVEAEPFEQICQALKTWAQSVQDSDADGVTRFSVSDLENFWQERSP